MSALRTNEITLTNLMKVAREYLRERPDLPDPTLEGGMQRLGDGEERVEYHLLARLVDLAWSGDVSLDQVSLRDIVTWLEEIPDPRGDLVMMAATRAMDERYPWRLLRAEIVERAEALAERRGTSVYDEIITLRRERLGGGALP